MANQKTRNIIVTGAILLLASACGGGGGGGSAPAPVVLPTATVSISSSASEAQVGAAVTITWSSTNATECSASGSWSGTKTASGTEDILISVGGSNTFSLNCSGSNVNSGSSSVSVNGFREFGGKVIDGYIRGALIYIDSNSNFTNDSTEPTTSTDNTGAFSNLKYADGVLISEGGWDLDTSANLNSLQLMQNLSGYSEQKVITPLTTIATLMSSPQNINAIFGVDAAIDISTTDPVANIENSGGKNLYEKGNQLTVLALSLQSALSDGQDATQMTTDYFTGIAEELELAFAALETPGIVDIESTGFISAVVDNISIKQSSSINDANKANVTQALVSVMPLIQVKNLSSTTTAIQNFTFTTLQNDLKAIATGDANPSTLNSYTSDIYGYIASSESIAQTELEIDILAQGDNVSLAEDASIEISPLLNDSYLRGQSISLSISSLPINGTATISADIITYTPNADWNGEEEFVYVITQGSKTATGTVKITVDAVNDKPVISTQGAISVNEAVSAITTIAAQDVDGDSLTYAVSGTDQDLFAIDASGNLSFVTAPDFESPSDSDADNIYNITISVSDGLEATDLEIAITVLNTAEESNAPVFTLVSVEPQTVDVTDLSKSVVIKLRVKDESDVVLTTWNAWLSLSGSPDIPDTQFQTGVANAWVLESGDARDGVYVATIEVPAGSIAGAYDIQGGFWEDVHGNTDSYWSRFAGGETVTIVNAPAPVGNTAPTLTLVSSYLVLENSTDVLTVSASDADGDTLTYSLSGDDASLLSISTSGVITFNTAPDYESPTDSNSDNTYSIIVSVSDGTDSATSSLAIEVQDLSEGGGASLVYKLYGGLNNETYLGCYGCSSVSAESICNNIGTYGSNIQPDSIWNSIGTYGSTISNDSPWNSIANNPPLIKSENGTLSYGKFSVNSIVANRTILSTFNDISDKFIATNSLTETRAFACPNS